MPPRLEPVKCDCTYTGCHRPAICTPVLFTPPHPLARNQEYGGVRSVMWLPVCERHILEVTPQLFLRKDEVRQSIAADFHLNGSNPHFEKAYILRLGVNNEECIALFEEQKRAIEELGSAASVAVH